MAFIDFEQALSRTEQVELRTTGRVSQRESSRPVWFVLDGKTLYLLPVSRSDSQWYKNVLATPAIRLAAGGAEYGARATPVTDPAEVGEVIDRFRAKYGAPAVKGYYSKLDVAVEVPPS